MTTKLFFFGHNPLVPRRRTPSNMEFSQEVRKVWPRIVLARIPTRVLLN
jgi:hypothetical protein